MLLCFVWALLRFSFSDVSYLQKYLFPQTKSRMFCVVLFCSQRNETTLCSFPENIVFLWCFIAIAVRVRTNDIFSAGHVYLLCLRNYLLMYLFWQFPVQTFSCTFFSCSSHFCDIRHCTLRCNQMAIRTESLTGVNCQCQ